ncbi:MAG: hypothetical protein K8R21_06585 [Leptospira sp.]|nr:hypothetical protein [Leptospira sp.]
MNKIKIEFHDESKTFAELKPTLLYLFYKKKYPNEYGGLISILKEGILYSTGLSGFMEEKDTNLEINISKFRLQADDKCYKNLTDVEFSAKVFLIQKKKRTEILDYNYSDSIESKVTDCFAVLSSLPVFLGWFVYLPYIGFRGNREDQMNLIGNNAVQGFLANLEISLTNSNQTGNKSASKKKE